MKKVLLATLLGSSMLLLSTGCSNTSSPKAGEETVTHSEQALYTDIHDDKHLKQIVFKAAKEKGWRVTKFTEKSVVAEKFDTENPKATTIKIQNGVIDFDNMPGTDESDIVDLKEYMEDLLKTEQEGH